MERQVSSEKHSSSHNLLMALYSLSLMLLVATRSLSRSGKSNLMNYSISRREEFCTRLAVSTRCSGREPFMSLIRSQSFKQAPKRTIQSS